MSANIKTHSAETEAIMLKRVRQLASASKGREDGLIQVLHMVQGAYGYLPLEVQRVVAEELEVPLSTVAGVVSFYSFFTSVPRGKHTIRVCLGTACYVRGGVSVVDEFESQLGIKVGETTADGMFTFEVARCIGACGLAPAITVDDKVYPKVKPDELAGIIESWYQKDAADTAATREVRP